MKVIKMCRAGIQVTSDLHRGHGCYEEGAIRKKKMFLENKNKIPQLKVQIERWIDRMEGPTLKTKLVTWKKKLRKLFTK